MKSRFYLSILLITFSFFFCNKPKVKKDKTILFLEKIEQLKEYKKAAKRVDSLNKIGMKSKLTISLLKNSFYAADSLKGSYSAIINEDLGISSKILFIVQYDKNTFEILSITPNK